MAVELRRRKFTVAEYYEIARAGVLSEDDRVELIEGEIMEMVPIGVRHAACVRRLIWLFTRTLPGKAIIDVQDPVRLGPHSEPQPDLLLLKNQEDFYAANHPGPEDVLLVIEVMETSLAYEREVKLPLYARHGIAEAWLVDLPGEKVVVYSLPSLQGYGDRQVYKRGQTISPRAFPEVRIAVNDILG